MTATTKNSKARLCLKRTNADWMASIKGYYSLFYKHEKSPRHCCLVSNA
jgi:hypothetical protein